MDCDKIINEIDQLIADAKEAFGEHSDTVRLLRDAYKVAEKEAEELAEWQRLGDQQEYAAAHAAGRISDARAINQEWKR